MTCFRHRRIWRSAAWLGVLALVIQSYLPLLIAGEIRALSTANPGINLVFDAGSGCLHDGSGDQQPHGHPGGAACPICLALATAHVFASPIAPAVAPPLSEAAAAPAASPAPAGTFFHLAASYDARGPPADA